MDVSSSYDLTTKGLDYKLKVEIASDKIVKQYDSKVKKISSTYNLPGFRKGMVPLNLIKKRYGESIFQDIVGNLADKSFQEILEKEKIKICGSPKIDLDFQKVKLGEDVSYTADFQCFPEFDLPDFKKLKLVNPEVVMDDKDIKDHIEKIIKENPTWKDSAAKVKDGDKVKIDYTGTIDGKEFEGGSQKNADLVIGSNQMLPGFESGIIGAKKGENVTCSVVFPSDYYSVDMRDKKADFSIQIHAVEKPSYLALGEELFKKIKSSAKTEQEYKDELIKGSKEKCSMLTDKLIESRVLSALSKYYDFQVPSTLVSHELEQASKSEENKKVDKSKIENSIRLTLVVQKLVEHYSLTVDQSSLKKYILSMAPEFIDSETFIKWYVQDKTRIQRAQVALLEQLVAKKVMDSAQADSQTLSMLEANKHLEKELSV